MMSTDLQTIEPEREEHSVEQRTTVVARDKAVADLTLSAYSNASKLADLLNDEQHRAIRREFGDECWRTGAGGKEHLIYIEHAFLRERLDEIFRAGGWAIITRSRWTESFTTGKQNQAITVYVEGMLVAKGCFIAEAIGSMVYYPNNAQQDFSDAVEGAESACLRRCCKKFGMGLQAWKKGWTEGWMQRRREGTLGKQQNGQQEQQKAAEPKPDPAVEFSQAIEDWRRTIEEVGEQPREAVLKFLNDSAPKLWALPKPEMLAIWKMFLEVAKSNGFAKDEKNRFTDGSAPPAPPGEPKTGAELLQRIEAIEKEYIAAGLCQPGHLVSYIRVGGQELKWGAEIQDWKPEVFKLAMDYCQQFKENHEAALKDKGKKAK
jgi:hypothetical protein